MQLQIDKMHEHLDGHHLKINVGKTAVIIFGKNIALTSGNVNVFLNGTRLNVCFYIHKYYSLNNSRYIYDFSKLWFDKYDVYRCFK